MQILGTVTSVFRGRRNSFAQNPELQNKQGGGKQMGDLQTALCGQVSTRSQ